MKAVKTFLVVMGFLVSANLAQAATHNKLNPLKVCDLSFHAEGVSVQLIIGYTAFVGTGTISCVDINGQVENLDVKVKILNGPIGLNVGYGLFDIYGLATGIGVATGPESLLGKYTSFNTNSAFILGTGATVAVHGGNEALTLNLGLNVGAGMGFQFGLNKLVISAL